MNSDEYSHIAVFLNQIEKLKRNWRNCIEKDEAKQNRSNLKNTILDNRSYRLEFNEHICTDFWFYFDRFKFVYFAAYFIWDNTLR